MSDTTSVTVETEQPEPDSSPDVVVVATEAGGGDDTATLAALAVTVGRHDAQIATLVEQVAGLVSTTAVVENTAELALDVAVDASQAADESEAVAEAAVDEAVEVAAEADAADEDDEDSEPGKQHVFWRSGRSLFGHE